MLTSTFDFTAIQHAIYALSASLAVLALSACSRRDADVAEAQSAPRAAAVTTVVATDDRFDAPDEIPAGLTTIRMVNQGQELHHVQLFRLPSGKTPADLAAGLTHPGPLPSWATAAGGPNAVAPGGTSDATVELLPGSYVMVCWVPGPDHVPHVAKGVMRPLTVTALEPVSQARPRSDLTVTLTEYAFTLSDPITAGSHTLRVENEGKQDHEAVLARLAPGKTVRDFAAWVDQMTGPPPAEPLGGLTALAPGSEGFVTLDFTPGHYALLCFVPDARDGKPHIVYGMMKEFTIQ